MDIRLKELADLINENGAEACLPHNLPDHLFEYLQEAVSEFLDCEPDDLKGEKFSGLLLCIVSILGHQKGYEGTISIGIQELFEKAQIYAATLTAEAVSRKTDIQVEPTTVDEIFNKNRKVAFYNKEEMVE